MEHEHETIKPSAGVAEVDGAGTATGTAAATAAATAPAPSHPDPMDAAMFHAGDVVSGNDRTVWLDDAKRIRDEAVAEAFHKGQIHGYDAAQAEAQELIEDAFTRGAAHAIGTLPPEVADLLDEIANAVDLDPVGEIEGDWP